MDARRADAAAGAALVVLWSSGFVGAELGTRFAPADTLLAWRYLVAAGVLTAVALVLGTRLGPRALLRQSALGLLCQCLYLGGVVTGVALGVPAGTTALVAALQPLLVAAAAGPLLGERTGRRQRVGLGVGLAGVALVVAGDLGLDGAPWWAFLLPVGGMAALSAGTLLERRLRPAETPLQSLTAQTVVAAGFFVAVAAAGGRLQPPADPAFWWAVAWVVVLSSFGGYGAYLVVLRRTGAVRVSTLLYLTPPTTMVWALLMFGEVPGPLALPGIALCAVGVALALRPRVAGTPLRSH
ncbi:DMT family transporter [Pseudonocardia sichuanensis]|uniref:Drug/metabolite transporter (DMT)-like permease n=1 Tax=Pseudonocardia kunmingensis TaxID=630975 RepID=A0A543DYK8_9PSEU|nr:DMT family transporter [Pseudonocardia kunmingensis]TQM14339.1 drug/metabolite transporter (DMT)-like permease [Pseudonocardia kunmingensis]